MSKFKIYRFFTGLLLQTCKEFAYSGRISINFLHNLSGRNIILFCILPFVLCSTMNAQNWHNLNSGTDYRLNVIYADTFDNYLYAGGYIHQAGGIGVQGMARWNGITWSAMANGANGDPYAIIRHNSELYVGGNFIINLIGGGHARSIAKWNGLTWDTLPVRPFDDVQTVSINAMASISNILYIGGVFNSVAGIPVHGLAKWNGTVWSDADNFPALDPNYNVINSIAVYNGEIYVGGQFYLNGFGNIAKWDGSNWVHVGNGFVGGMASVVKLVVYKNELYAAGTFSKTDNPANPGNYIAKWDGSSWSDVGGGVIGVYGGNGQIWDLFVYNNELYAGGVFSYAGGVHAEIIAKWDGTKWCGLGSVFDNDVTTMACYHDSLYIGGAFQFIDGDTVNYIAKWTGGNYVDTCGNNSGINEINDEEKSIIVFPNPFNTFTSLQLSKPIQNATLSIYNVLGKEVKTLQNLNGTEIIINREGMKSGMYFYNLIDSKGLIGRGKMIVE